MDDKDVRIYLNILREAIEQKSWSKVSYVADLLNMNTIHAVCPHCGAYLSRECLNLNECGSCGDMLVKPTHEDKMAARSKLDVDRIFKGEL
jgi:hypothetical protein